MDWSAARSAHHSVVNLRRILAIGLASTGIVRRDGAYATT